MESLFMQEYDRWLKIAKSDLLSAKVLCKNELFSQAIYHCQQTAEKSFKGYLAFKKQPILKTHDLIKLLDRCVIFDQSFETLLDAANYLNPFSTKFRYPTEYDILDIDELKLAIKNAKTVFDFVIKKIAGLKTGQQELFDT
jgi:HEPN domain-containing protein